MARVGLVVLAFGIFALQHNASAFLTVPVGLQNEGHVVCSSAARRKFAMPLKLTPKDKMSNPEEVTKKYGLEAGLFSAFKQGNGGVDAKELLKKYGSAYLVTSISLSLVSFGLCYVLVDAGVDVAALLSKIGIEASPTSEKAGTAALAYAVHKAASPLRFPPTVALTPLVASVLFKKKIPEE